VTKTLIEQGFPSVLVNLTREYYTSPYPLTDLQKSFDPETTTIPSSMKMEYHETVVFLTVLEGIKLVKRYYNHSPSKINVEVSPFSKRVAIQNLHFKCLDVRKQLGTGPMKGHIFSTNATWLDVNNLLQLQIEFERRDESKYSHWSAAGRACCSSSFLSTFFMVPVDPVPSGKAWALAENADWMARTGAGINPFGQDLYLPGSEHGHGLGIGIGLDDDDCSQPWPTLDSKVFFVKTVFADVLKSPESLWAPIYWIGDICGDGEDDTVREPEFQSFFNTFVGLLSFDFSLSVERKEDLIHQTSDLLFRLHDDNNPFYHTFVQFAAKVSAKFGPAMTQ
jgi:hypothetical protein